MNGHDLYKDILEDFDRKIKTLEYSMKASAIEFAEKNDEKYRIEYLKYKNIVDYIKQCKTVITSRGGEFTNLVERK